MGKLFLWVFLSGVLILIIFMPITIAIDAHYDMNRRKFAFGAYLYRKIKLLGGYIGVYPGGLALHISKNKAKLIPYSKLNSERKRFSFLRSFHLYIFTLTTETGAEYLLTITAIHTYLRAYLLANGVEEGKIESNLWLTDGDELRISVSSVIYFNLAMIFVNFIKFIKEKMKIIWRRKTKKSTI